MQITRNYLTCSIVIVASVVHCTSTLLLYVDRARAAPCEDDPSDRVHEAARDMFNRRFSGSEHSKINNCHDI